jgi:hypothetical protein
MLSRASFVNPSPSCSAPTMQHNHNNIKAQNVETMKAIIPGLTGFPGLGVGVVVEPSGDGVPNGADAGVTGTCPTLYQFL